MAHSAANTLLQRKKSQLRDSWLRKHSDYQRVYREGKRQSLSLMTYFYARRTDAVPDPDAEASSAAFMLLSRHARVGLTAGKVLGNAVQRNRIKRRMRHAVQTHYGELAVAADIILHPRRTVLDADFAQIEREVQRVFRTVQASLRSAPSTEMAGMKPVGPARMPNRAPSAETAKTE